MTDKKIEIRELFKSEKSRIYAVALRLTGRHHEAEDAVQDTWLAALKSKHKFRGESLATTWIYRIAVRSAIAVRNRNQKTGMSLDIDVNAREGMTAEKRESIHALLEALNTLSPEQRSVIALSAVEKLGAEQIGKILGIPQGTVWSRLSNARKTLIANWDR